MRKRNLVTEAHVQEAVVQMLVLDGWRPFRTDPVSDIKRAKGFGEVGMPDYIFLRYLYDHGHNTEAICSCGMKEGCVCGEILWCEFKRPGEASTAHQLAWHEKERVRGALVMVFDSLESAREWYKTSGLMRHQILS